MKCPLCKAKIEPDDNYCRNCGTALSYRGARRNIVARPEVWVALLLSFPVSGPGQIYCGQTAKGSMMVAVWTGLVVAAIAAHGVMIFAWLGWFVLCMVDAGVIAYRLRRGEEVSSWRFF